MLPFYLIVTPAASLAYTVYNTALVFSPDTVNTAHTVCNTVYLYIKSSYHVYLKIACDPTGGSKRPGRI